MNILRAELTKLTRKKSTLVLLSLYCITYIGIVLFYLVGENALDVSLYNSNQFVGASLKIMMGFLFPLLALYLASSSIALDYSKGTIKNMYLLPINKDMLYAGKIIAVQGIIGAVLALQLVLSISFSIIQEGFSLTGLGTYFLQYIGAFFVLLLVNLFGTTLTLWIKNTGLVIIISYTAYIVAGIINLYVPAIKSISFRHLIGNYTEFFRNGSLSLLLSIVAYYIIVFVVGLILFDKKDENICQFD